MIFEKDGQILTLKEFEELTCSKWVRSLEFEEPKILLNLRRQAEKFYKKGELSFEQMWLGKYFKKEIQERFEPNVAIRYISPELGWGVFALQNFRKMQFIAEYAGKVKKREKQDDKNAYCFEYLVTQGIRSPYTIDAMGQGNLSRFINHSEKPNLKPALATFDHLTHVVLFAKEPIAKGEQLCYDYGPDYWAKRRAPLVIL